MDTNTSAPAASAEAALVDQIRADVRGAAELAGCLALRGTQIATTAAPSQTTLANLAAAGQSVADQARSTSEAIFLLTRPATNPAGQPAAEDTVTRLRYAGEWATMLHCQIKTAVKIHALICAELSDRAAIVFVNAAAEVLFGYRREEILGKLVEILVPDRYRPSQRGHLDRFTASAFTRRVPIDVELLACREDG